jgi:transcriptional regulator with XRE-family HTH domain
MKEHIGEHIAHYRKKAGLTQEQLAEKMGITAQAVSKWENGLTCPDLDSVARLADFLGVSVEQLIHGDSALPSVKVVETPQVGRRVLCIHVQAKGSVPNVIVRFPVELILKAYEMGCLESLVGDEAPFVEQAVEMIRQGAVGSLVDVETEDTFVKIEVMKV